MFDKIKKAGMLAFSMVAGAMLFSQNYYAERYHFVFQDSNGKTVFSWKGEIGDEEAQASQKEMASHILKHKSGSYYGDHSLEVINYFKSKQLLFSNYYRSFKDTGDDPVLFCSDTYFGDQYRSSRTPKVGPCDPNCIIVESKD